MSNLSCNCSKDNHRQENNEMLKSAKLKATKKRMLLLNCLRHSDLPLTAEEIHTYLKKEINTSGLAVESFISRLKYQFRRLSTYITATFIIDKIQQSF